MTISLYMKDNTFSGRVQARTQNWNGVVIKIPRARVNQEVNAEYVQNSGVYFLFGADKTAYIGHACVRKKGNGLLNRVTDPHNTIDWDTAVLVTTLDNSLGLTEIGYLENRLCHIATEAGQYQICNRNQPNDGNVTEEIRENMEKFMSHIRELMPILGYDILRPVEKKVEKKKGPVQKKVPKNPKNPKNSCDTSENSDDLLYMKHKTATATCRKTKDGFILQKGSKICLECTPSCPTNTRLMREYYQSRIGEDGTLLSDICMSSASTAAQFVAGSSQNGRDAWRTKDGKKLKELK